MSESYWGQAKRSKELHEVKKAGLSKESFLSKFADLKRGERRKK